jgi:hypothetical protein
LPFLSCCCPETEVSEQLYYIICNKGVPYGKPDDGKYRLIVDSLTAHDITRFGGPPANEKDRDTYAAGIFSPYVPSSNPFTRFINRIPVNVSTIPVIDKSRRSMFIDTKNNRNNKNSVTTKPETIRSNGILEPRQISETNRFALYLLLKNNFKESAKRQSLNHLISPPPPEQSQNVKPKTASGTREKDFKAMAVNGQAADVIAAFKTITSHLSEKDTSDLSTSPKASGIDTSHDLQGLLNQGKDEVREQDRKKPYRTQACSVSRRPSIGV